MIEWQERRRVVEFYDGLVAIQPRVLLGGVLLILGRTLYKIAGKQQQQQNGRILFYIGHLKQS